jgi:hypothetical protein
VSAVADVLNVAADLIERDGWCQGYFTDPLGRRCVDGAICATSTMLPTTHWTDRAAARSALLLWLGERHIDWNDAPGRTQAEVVAALRAAAERAA